MTCETCGGACCRFVVVLVGDMTPDQRRWAEMRGPLRQVRDGVWEWELPVACPQLTADGRCGIYEARPDVCKGFKVGGAMCQKAMDRKGKA